MAKSDIAKDAKEYKKEHVIIAVRVQEMNFTCPRRYFLFGGPVRGGHEMIGLLPGVPVRSPRFSLFFFSSSVLCATPQIAVSFHPRPYLSHMSTRTSPPQNSCCDKSFPSLDVQGHATQPHLETDAVDLK